MSHEHEHHHHPAFHCAVEVAKIALKAAAVTAAFLAVKEIHKVHTEIANHSRNVHHHLLAKK